MLPGLSGESHQKERTRTMNLLLYFNGGNTPTYLFHCHTNYTSIGDTLLEIKPLNYTSQQWKYYYSGL